MKLTLGMPLRVHVILQNKVVLAFSDLYCDGEIARLEDWVKLQVGLGIVFSYLHQDFRVSVEGLDYLRLDPILVSTGAIASNENPHSIESTTIRTWYPLNSLLTLTDAWALTFIRWESTLGLDIT